MKSKKNGEFAYIFVSGVLDDCKKRSEDFKDLDSKLDGMLRVLIQNTTSEIINQKTHSNDSSETMEKKLKRALSNF